MASIGIGIEFLNLKEVVDYLEDFPEETFDDAKVVFQKAVLDAHKQVSKNFGPKLQSRSGSLRRSIRTFVGGTTIESLRASIFGARFAGGSELVYTLAQEYGTEREPIRAKRAYKGVPGGPYLNVPLPANKTPAGVTRLGAREVFNMGGYIRGRAVFLGNTAMFALVKQVKFPGRLGMRDAAADQVPTILSRLQDAIGEN